MLNQGGSDLVHLSNLGPGVVNIGEDHGRATEDSVFQVDAVIDRDIVLDFAPIPYCDIWSDDHVLADVAIRADPGALKDVGEMPDFRARTDFAFFIDNSRRMEKSVACGE